MGIAINPELRLIFVRDGNALDNESLVAMSRMADERECQILMERIEHGGQAGIEITDGEVSDVREAATS